MANNRRQKDQDMAAMLKANRVERTTGRCAICYNLIPNGLFAPAKWDMHLMSCPGPRRKGARDFRVSGRRAA